MFEMIFLQVQHTMQFPGEYRVEWMSPEETYMHLGENLSYILFMGVGGALILVDFQVQYL